MGQIEVEAFPTMLAHERQVAPATHRRARNALLFLYKQLPEQDLPWMQSIGRPPERKRVRVVLTANEVQAVLTLIHRTGRVRGPSCSRHGHALSRRFESARTHSP